MLRPVLHHRRLPAVFTMVLANNWLIIELVGVHTAGSIPESRLTRVPIDEGRKDAIKRVR